MTHSNLRYPNYLHLTPLHSLGLGVRSYRNALNWWNSGVTIPNLRIASAACNPLSLEPHIQQVYLKHSFECFGFEPNITHQLGRQISICFAVINLKLLAENQGFEPCGPYLGILRFSKPLHYHPARLP